MDTNRGDFKGLARARAAPRTICPSCQSAEAARLAPSGNQWLSFARLVPDQGRAYRDRLGRWAREAMDALAAAIHATAN